GWVGGPLSGWGPSCSRARPSGKNRSSPPARWWRRDELSSRARCSWAPPPGSCARFRTRTSSGSSAQGCATTSATWRDIDGPRPEDRLVVDEGEPAPVPLVLAVDDGEERLLELLADRTSAA